MVRLELSPRPTEMMTLVMVLDEGGSIHLLLFCLDDDELGVLLGLRLCLVQPLLWCTVKPKCPPTPKITGRHTPGAPSHPEKD